MVFADTQLPGDIDGMKRARAAVREHNEIARIKTLGGGDGPHRVGHLRVGDAQNAEGGGIHSEIEALCKLVAIAAFAPSRSSFI